MHWFKVIKFNFNQWSQFRGVLYSAAVAEFGMILRNSKYKGNATKADVISLASGARGTDSDGYRAEFIRLVGSAK